ncbi:MAG TPA: hypothetical protein VFD15_00760 [Clostridia bacterium]|nr:hypothetical protein [Clostridia bacterium]
MGGKKIPDPTIRVIFSNKGDGLRAAYRYLAKKILEEKLHAVRDLR